MSLLTPYMNFPAFFRTQKDREAIVVGEFNGRYYGHVDYTTSGEPLEDYTVSWNADGQVMRMNGEPFSSSFYTEPDDLVDPMTLYDAAYAELTEHQRDMCRLIYLGASNGNQKINGIRAIRTAIPGTSLSAAKRWYEHTIPQSI